MRRFTIKVNNTVMTQPGTQEKPDAQHGKTASTKEPQTINHQETPETAGILSFWSVGLIVASVCLVSLALSVHTPRWEVSTTIDFVMISSPLDEHKALHTRIKGQQYRMQHQQDKASRNQTEQTPEPRTYTPEMMREES